MTYNSIYILLFKKFLLLFPLYFIFFLTLDRIECSRQKTINQLPDCSNPDYIIYSKNFPKDYPDNLICQIVFNTKPNVPAVSFKQF